MLWFQAFEDEAIQAALTPRLNVVDESSHGNLSRLSRGYNGIPLLKTWELNDYQSAVENFVQSSGSSTTKAQELRNGGLSMWVRAVGKLEVGNADGSSFRVQLVCENEQVAPKKTDDIEWQNKLEYASIEVLMDLFTARMSGKIAELEREVFCHLADEPACRTDRCLDEFNIDYAYNMNGKTVAVIGKLWSQEELSNRSGGCGACGLARALSFWYGRKTGSGNGPQCNENNATSRQERLKLVAHSISSMVSASQNDKLLFDTKEGEFGGSTHAISDFVDAHRKCVTKRQSKHVPSPPSARVPKDQNGGFLLTPELASVLSASLLSATKPVTSCKRTVLAFPSSPATSADPLIPQQLDEPHSNIGIPRLYLGEPYKNAVSFQVVAAIRRDQLSVDQIRIKSNQLAYIGIKRAKSRRVPPTNGREKTDSQKTKPCNKVKSENLSEGPSIDLESEDEDCYQFTPFPRIQEIEEDQDWDYWVKTHFCGTMGTENTDKAGPKHDRAHLNDGNHDMSANSPKNPNESSTIADKPSANTKLNLLKKFLYS